MKLSEAIKKSREDAGLSRAELAEKIGKSVPAICKYEQGQREPRMETLVDICKATNVSLNRFLDYIYKGV